MSMQSIPPMAFRAKDASSFIGIGESTFWKWVAAGKLPKGKHLSARCTVWKREDLERFLDCVYTSSCQNIQPQSDAANLYRGLEGGKLFCVSGRNTSPTLEV